MLGTEDDDEMDLTEDGNQDEEDMPAPSTGPQGKGHQSEGDGDQGDVADAVGAEEETRGAPPTRDSAQQRKPPNPFQQKGDINKQWHEKLNIVPPETMEEDGDEDEDEDEDGVGDGAHEEEADVPAPKGLFRHIHDNSKMDQDQQVLTDAAEEEEHTSSPENHQNEKEEEDKAKEGGKSKE